MRTVKPRLMDNMLKYHWGHWRPARIYMARNQALRAGRAQGKPTQTTHHYLLTSYNATQQYGKGGRLKQTKGRTEAANRIIGCCAHPQLLMHDVLASRPKAHPLTSTHIVSGQWQWQTIAVLPWGGAFEAEWVYARTVTWDWAPI